MPAPSLPAIDNACQAMTEGFFEYYQNLVDYYHQHPKENLDYYTFRDRTNRATNALISEQEAIFYMVAYGWQHHQSIQHLFSKTLKINPEVQAQIRVLDYGCGQGVATLAFMEYLAQNDAAKGSALEVHLIEPSTVSLSIAKLLILRLAEIYEINVTIHCQPRTLDKALIPLQTSCADTVHLFSNVIDIAAVQDALPQLAEQLQSCSGKNFLFATCPSYGKAQLGFEQLRQQMDFGDCYYDEWCYLTHRMYRVVESRWLDYEAKHILMSISWSDE